MEVTPRKAKNPPQLSPLNRDTMAVDLWAAESKGNKCNTDIVVHWLPKRWECTQRSASGHPLRWRRVALTPWISRAVCPELSASSTHEKSEAHLNKCNVCSSSSRLQSSWCICCWPERVRPLTCRSAELFWIHTSQQKEEVHVFCLNME